jgi:pilus assembly protein CpaE
VLLDLVMNAGQVALMLNSSLRRTWADVTPIPAGELDAELVHSVVTRHESGLYFIPAPTYPTEVEGITAEWLRAILGHIAAQYEYVVADLPHDFGDIAIEVLDAADVILLLLAPDLSSVRAAAAALDTYARLDYPSEKIKLVLNTTFPRHALPRDKIEAALSRPVTLSIPYVPDRFVEAINKGLPPMFAQPEDPIAALLEDFTFLLSQDKHKKSKPANPSAGWRRVYKRFAQRRK